MNGMMEKTLPREFPLTPGDLVVWTDPAYGAIPAKERLVKIVNKQRQRHHSTGEALYAIELSSGYTSCVPESELS